MEGNYSIKIVAKKLAISTRSVTRLIAEGQLVAFKCRRCVRITVESYKDYRKKQTGGRYMFEINRWSAEENEILKKWIIENKDEPVSYLCGHPTLNKLLPARSPGGIYARWRVKTGNQQKNESQKTEEGKNKRNINNILGGALENIIREEVDKVVKAKTLELTQENQELKSQLRELKSIREAVERYQKII